MVAKNALAVQSDDNQLAAFQFGEAPVALDELIGSQGNEEVTADERTIPQLKILQPMSEPCQGKNAKHKAGTLYLTGLDESFDPDVVPVYFVPVLFGVGYIELPPQGEDMVIVNRYTKMDIDDLVKAGVFVKDTESVAYVYKDGECKNKIKKSYKNVGIALLPDGRTIECVMYMKSTSIRSGDDLNTKIDGRRIDGKTLKRYANVFQLGIEEKANEKSTWYTPLFTHVLNAGAPVLPPTSVFRMAEKLYKELMDGAVKLEEDEVTSENVVDI